MDFLISAARRWFLAALVVASLLGSTAQGVIISSAYDTANRAAPGDDPGWNNVAQMSGATAVYLGNRWMITANHVPSGTVQFSDGRTFNIQSGSNQIPKATNSAFSGNSDLRLFRLTADPGLPRLEIAARSAVEGERVVMIGAGQDRNATQIGWVLTGNENAPTWTQVPVSVAQIRGWTLANTHTMRWGVNQAGEAQFTSGGTVGFPMSFDRLGLPFEAQATVGDSGGGVFVSRNGNWSLAGILDEVTALPGQARDDVAFGDKTIAMDLAFYRDQISTLINPLDVDGSGTISPRDVLRVINELTRSGTHSVSGDSPFALGRLDVNDDGQISPQDMLLIVNHLTPATAANAAAVPSLATFNGTPVPEPGAFLLALWGLVGLILGRGIARARKRGLRPE